MCHGDDTHLSGEGPQVGGTPTVDAKPLGEDPLPHDRLGERADGGLDLLLHSLGVGEALRHSGGDRLGGAAFGIAPGGLVGDGKRLGQLVAARLGHGCGNVVAVVDRQLVVHRGLHAGSGDEAPL